MTQKKLKKKKKTQVGQKTKERGILTKTDPRTKQQRETTRAGTLEQISQGNLHQSSHQLWQQHTLQHDWGAIWRLLRFFSGTSESSKGVMLRFTWTTTCFSHSHFFLSHLPHPDSYFPHYDSSFTSFSHICLTLTLISHTMTHHLLLPLTPAPPWPLFAYVYI